MSFNAALKKLHNSIVSGDISPAIPLVRPKQHMSAEEQLGIYAYAYKARLQNAVRSDYPCLLHALGTEKFDDLVTAFVDATPSQSYNLDFYPHAFWRFLKTQSIDLWVQELAELEGAIAETFMGDGSEALTLQNLPPLTEETLGQMKFYLRTPHRLLHFTHDVEETVARFKRGETPASPSQKTTHLYIYRHNNEVQRRTLDKIEFYLLNAIEETDSFNTAIERAIKSAGCNETAIAASLGNWLSRWISEGFLAA